jgi:hypothetical protein
MTDALELRGLAKHFGGAVACWMPKRPRCSRACG